MSEEQGVTLFDAMRVAMERIVSAAAGVAAAHEIAPTEFKDMVATACVGIAFQVCVTDSTAQDAARLLQAHVRGAESAVLFGRAGGQA